MTMPIFMQSVKIASIDGGDLHVAKAVADRLHRLLTNEPKADDPLALRFYMKELQSTLRELENDRKASKEPFLSAAKQVDTFFAAIKAEADGAMERVKAALLAYEMEQRRLAQEQRASEDAAHTDDRPTAPILPTSTPVAPPVRIPTYEKVTVRVTDIKAVPAEFLLVDEAKVKAAWAAGISVPGVERVVETLVAAR